jgi:3-deoxy-7-phosphoheptulonate synthase
MLNTLAAVMEEKTRSPVIRVGRIAGQFAKPRSRPTELVNGRELPVFRGHLVNGPEPVTHRRLATPERLVAGYRAARDAFEILRRREEPVWTSHDAVLLDYELPMLRPGRDGQVFLASTHWPWAGVRTGRADGAHIAMLALVANPVACKVGPTVDLDELLSVCERLDPLREPGRLTLISRMGADAVAATLPPLVEAVRTAGHPAIWLCDPMHGNTVTGPGGRKTRLLDTVAREVREFQAAVERAGGIAGGLHLETTPDDVTECVPDASHLEGAGGAYTTLCDPRLNPDQAVEIVSTWWS